MENAEWGRLTWRHRLYAATGTLFVEYDIQ